MTYEVLVQRDRDGVDVQQNLGAESASGLELDELHYSRHHRDESSAALLTSHVIASDDNEGASWISHSDGSSLDFANELQEEAHVALTRAEIWDVVMLFFLYLGQGVAAGLIGGTIPLLLKPYLSYGSAGLFSIAFYPYSIKVLWSPLVDSLWNKRIGRRKSWIVPMQSLSGLVLIMLGWMSPQLVQNIEQHDGNALWVFVAIGTLIISLSATEGCAADGWSVALLPPRKAHFTSSAHSLGLIAGEFSSYTIFLFFYSRGLINLRGFLGFWGVFNLIVASSVLLFGREDRSEPRVSTSVAKAYKAVLQLLQLLPLRRLIVIHLIARIGFEVNDSAMNLKLQDKNFGLDNIALLAAIDVPFDILSSIISAFLCNRYQPIVVWCWAFVGRLNAAIMAQLMLMLYPDNGVTIGYFILVSLEHVISTSMSTTMHLAFLTFHLQIADPIVGGTYMTLLATVQNMGGTLPRVILMKLIDVTTISSCEYPLQVLKTSNLSTPVSSCTAPEAKISCIQGGGSCHVVLDGYYIVNAACILTGGLLFFGYIRSVVLTLQKIPREEWLLKISQN